MCLAVPMRVLEIDGSSGVVELEGIRRRVFIGFLDEVRPGDYILIHAGCAVEKLRPEEAAADLEMFRQLAEGPDAQDEPRVGPDGPKGGVVQGPEKTSSGPNEG